MEYKEVKHFLRSYLSVQDTGDLSAAVASYARLEGKQALRSLQMELKGMLASDLTEAQLRTLFAGEGFYQTSDEADAHRRLLIEIFEHVQVMSFQPDIVKPYDAFISYSSVDKHQATRLANELREKGFTIWLDTWEIMVGHNIVDEMYRGITESEFLIVVLSPASCKSQWVQEELTTTKISEIEQRRVVILPAMMAKCELPSALRQKRYVDFVTSWDEGLRQITTAIERHRSFAHFKPTPSEVQPHQFNLLDELRKNLIPEIHTAGFPNHEGFKDTVIGPPDNVTLHIDKNRFLSLINDCRVHLSGWGGSNFPYDKYPQTQEIRLPNGIRYVDTHPWPYTDWSFHFWQIDQNLRFFHRTEIEEDHAQDMSGEKLIENKLGYEWALMDITRPLLFARNMLNYEKRVGVFAVNYAWKGIQGRKLTVLSRSRKGFRLDYECRGTNEWVYQLLVTLNTDLLVEAKRAASDLFWLFSWVPSANMQQDLETFLSGGFPH